MSTGVDKNVTHRQENRERVINGTVYRFEHSHWSSFIVPRRKTQPTDQDIESCRIDVHKRTADYPGGAQRWILVHRILTRGKAEPYTPVRRPAMSSAVADLLIRCDAALANEGIGPLSFTEEEDPSGDNRLFAEALAVVGIDRIPEWARWHLTGYLATGPNITAPDRWEDQR